MLDTLRFMIFAIFVLWERNLAERGEVGVNCSSIKDQSRIGKILPVDEPPRI